MTKGWTQTVKTAWGAYWQDRIFRRSLAGALAVSILTLIAFSRLLLWIEQRPGVILPDPLLRFSPVDLTWLSFAAIYGGILLAIWKLLPDPPRLLTGIIAYTLLLWIRSLTLWLTPLDPPPMMILLRDPLVEWIGTGGTTLSRDLFFSGHTAGLVLLTLILPPSRIRWMMAGLATTVGIAVIAQHVHYSIDVVAAPFFAAGAAALGKRLVRRLLITRQSP